MCPAYAEKAGNECKKWAKVVPSSVEAVQSGTGVGLLAGMGHSRHGRECTAKDAKSTK
jgi:hypothetical protein